MSWLEEKLIPQQSTEIDFNLLQFYVLVVLYYEAVGKAWTSSVSLSRDQWLQKNDFGEYNFCEWRGIGCIGTNITSLQLNGEGLVGSIPPEIAALGQKLSKQRFERKHGFAEFCNLTTTFACYFVEQGT